MSASQPTIPEIADALSFALSQISGLRVLPYLSDNFAAPCALIGIEDVVYDGAFDLGDVVHTFTVYIIASRASEQAGIELIEGYMSQAGNSSVRAAIMSDPTLGGVVSSAWLQKSGPPRALTIGSGGAVYTSVPFTVIVHA